uniref:Uncharacterized protein n=1 Tax=Anguilla anguilla TaxID=7936 RepID=A0A0E9VMR2_ANGAN
MTNTQALVHYWLPVQTHKYLLLGGIPSRQVTP